MATAADDGDGDGLVYLDHNATTPIAAEVVEAMLPYLTRHHGNPSSDHPPGRRARRAVETAREQVAALIGATSDEVVFTSGGTEANNLAILGRAPGAPARRRRVVTTTVEHPATEQPCRQLEELGWSVERVPVGPGGAVDAQQVVAALTADVALLTVMLAQNETGALMPVAEVARAAADLGVTTHTDAAQAVGKVPVRVDDLGVDLLSIAGHKLYAPKGVGALYVRRGTTLSPVLRGAGQERGMRPGTENVASIVGLGAAAALARQHLEDPASRQAVAILRDRLWQSLTARIPGLARHTPENSLPNTLNVSFPGVLGADLLGLARGLAASTGSACHAGETSPSAVLLAMGVSPEVARGSVRLSLGRWTTVEDVDRAVDLLVAAAERQR